MIYTKITETKNYTFHIYEIVEGSKIFYKKITLKHNVTYQRFEGKKYLYPINFDIPIDEMKRKYKSPYFYVQLIQ